MEVVLQLGLCVQCSKVTRIISMVLRSSFFCSLPSYAEHKNSVNIFCVYNMVSAAHVNSLFERIVTKNLQGWHDRSQTVPIFAQVAGI